MADQNIRLTLNSQQIEESIGQIRSVLNSSAVPFIWDRNAAKDFSAFVPRCSWISGLAIARARAAIHSGKDANALIEKIGGTSKDRILLLGSDAYFWVLLHAEAPIPDELWPEISDLGFLAGAFPSWSRILAR